MTRLVVDRADGCDATELGLLVVGDGLFGVPVSFRTMEADDATSVAVPDDVMDQIMETA